MFSHSYPIYWISPPAPCIYNLIPIPTCVPAIHSTVISNFCSEIAFHCLWPQTCSHNQAKRQQWHTSNVTRLRFTRDLWHFTNVLWLIDWMQSHSITEGWCYTQDSPAYSAWESIATLHLLGGTWGSTGFPLFYWQKIQDFSRTFQDPHEKFFRTFSEPANV